MYQHNLRYERYIDFFLTFALSIQVFKAGYHRSLFCGGARTWRYRPGEFSLQTDLVRATRKS